MNIKGELREQLLEHELNQLMTEGKVDDVIGNMLSTIVTYIKKYGKKILEKLGAFEVQRKIKLWLGNFEQAYSDYKAGKLDPKNPNYDKEADVNAWNVLKDGLKVLGFVGMNMTLNYFLFGTGFVAGISLVHFRKNFPQLLKKFFHLSVDNLKEKVDEFMSLMEDMSYFHADDATQDQYKIGS